MVMLCGLIVQLGHGYHHFQFGLYLTDLFADRLVTFWILCVVALLIHTIVNNKYLGHFRDGAVLRRRHRAAADEFSGLSVSFGTIPAVTYSDMNGYGPFARPLSGFTCIGGLRRYCWPS